jgi:hypothetical protein
VPSADGQCRPDDRIATTITSWWHQTGPFFVTMAGVVLLHATRDLLPLGSQPWAILGLSAQKRSIRMIALLDRTVGDVSGRE